ncbi:NifB/NifX family molybdenum-iron cluster-binding protein [Deferrisoma palaeochoriense]
MDKTVIAVPSQAPGGLDAPRSGHFGRCDAFTLVAVKDKQVLDTRVVPNVEHTEGGCLVPVQLLYREGATCLVVAGIGMRPLLGFQQAGIDVLVGPGTTVGEVVQAYLDGLVRPIQETDVCGGHHSHA